MFKSHLGRACAYAHVCCTSMLATKIGAWYKCQMNFVEYIPLSDDNLAEKLLSQVCIHVHIGRKHKKRKIYEKYY